MQPGSAASGGRARCSVPMVPCMLGMGGMLQGCGAATHLQAALSLAGGRGEAGQLVLRLAGVVAPAPESAQRYGQQYAVMRSTPNDRVALRGEHAQRGFLKLRMCTSLCMQASRWATVAAARAHVRKPPM